MRPDFYVHLNEEIQSVNGSSAVGLCGVPFATSDTRTACYDISSVLFDEYVPILLSGDRWASLLLTIHPTTSTTHEIIFNFNDDVLYQHAYEVEVVMFNCPQWGVSAKAISVLEDYEIMNTVNITLTSCDSLVRVCVPIETSTRVIGLQFSLPPDSDWVHVAEVAFHGVYSTCPIDIILDPLQLPPELKPPDIMDQSKQVFLYLPLCMPSPDSLCNNPPATV